MISQMRLTVSRSVFLWNMALLFICSSAVAQDRVPYEVTLEVVDNVLSITSPSNCADGREKGEVCIPGGHGAELVFALGRGSQDWAFSRMRIRDPELNWGDALNERIASQFPQFDASGNYFPRIQEGAMRILDDNLHPVVVQYSITVRSRETNSETLSAFATIDNTGGAPPRAE